MKTVSEITEAIRGKETYNYRASTYTMFGDVLVRVSDHLPKVCNIRENNEDVKNIFFVFAESDVTEREADDFFASTLKEYNCDYIIIDDSYDYTVEDMRKYNTVERSMQLNEGIVEVEYCYENEEIMSVKFNDMEVKDILGDEDFTKIEDYFNENMREFMAEDDSSHGDDLYSAGREDF
jgi:hypothetical protein